MGLEIRTVICALWRMPDDVDIVDAARWLGSIGVGATIYDVDRVAWLVITHPI